MNTEANKTTKPDEITVDDLFKWLWNEAKPVGLSDKKRILESDHDISELGISTSTFLRKIHQLEEQGRVEIAKTTIVLVNKPPTYETRHLVT